MPKPKIETVDLATIAMGAATERANEAIAEVIHNILDPNNPAEATREVTVKIAFKPTKGRDTVTYAITCKSKLSPAIAVEGMLYIGLQGGVPVMFENNPEQHRLEFNEKSNLEENHD